MFISCAPNYYAVIVTPRVVNVEEMMYETMLLGSVPMDVNHTGLLRDDTVRNCCDDSKKSSSE